MKQLLFLLVCSTLFSCQKQYDDPGNSGTNNNLVYYFDCKVDGKDIHIPIIPSSSFGRYENGISVTAIATDQLFFQFQASQCNTLGSYCVGSSLQIAGQKIGDYIPSSFALSIPDGAIINSYVFVKSMLSSSNPDHANVSITIKISKIEQRNGTKLGILQGTFLGIASKTTTNGLNIAISKANVAGSFSLPLVQ